MYIYFLVFYNTAEIPRPKNNYVRKKLYYGLQKKVRDLNGMLLPIAFDT